MPEKRQTITRRDRERARREEAARERGKALPHYAEQVGREFVHPSKPGRATPSKKAD